MLDSILRPLSRYKDGIMLYGLALVPLLAGASKFLGVQWITPDLLLSLPVDTATLVAGAGAVEFLAGLALLVGGLWKKTSNYTYIVALVITAWLLAITLMVATEGYSTVAIRDLGLTVFALSVALNEYARKAQNTSSRSQALP